MRACVSLGLLLAGMAAVVNVSAPATTVAADRPNILWITCEDMSTDLGCYGDEYAVTPTLDQFATESVRYTHAFAPIGVCAPARSSLIMSVYAPSVGTQHMRCQGTLPEYIKCFTQYLRDAGYYCTNNSKTDYNFKHDPAAWDESSNQAHWRNRRAGQPFFSVFNFTTTHEGQIRLSDAQHQERTSGFTDEERHDPHKAPVPAYHPDEPAVRGDWAHYYDNITVMDKQVAQLLAQLADDQLAEDTIVFYYSDHGAGMPRGKRWLYDSSTHVPLMIRFPEKYQQLAPGPAGSSTDRLVNFVDFGATVLSLAGVQIPEHVQGRAFLGAQAQQPREYVFGFRDRMDERYDMIRSVRDKRYKYIRNYMPHLPWFHHQHISYMYEMPTMQVWQQLADAGKLEGPPAVFMAMHKPTEELYDTQNDPDEVNNLAGSPEHQEILERMRDAHRQYMIQIVDLGLLPEADLRTRFGDRAPHEVVRQDPNIYPFERIAKVADLAAQRNVNAIPQLVEHLKDQDAAVRYWAAIGLAGLAKQASDASEALRQQLNDSAPAARLAAADALCWMGHYDAAYETLVAGLQDENEWARLYAANILDRIDLHAREALPELQKAQQDSNNYVQRVAEHAVRQLSDGK